MASYQRIALYIFFDAIERDLIRHIRSVDNQINERFLTDQEREKAEKRMNTKNDSSSGAVSDFDLLHFLDIGDKLALIWRFGDKFDAALWKHLRAKRQALQSSVPIRNALMHGRPLTVSEHASSFALANDLVREKAYWPNLMQNLTEYDKDPEAVTQKSITFLENTSESSIFHNLPLPDYDDTGFVPRSKLEIELKKKILGRHPVVTVLGDGGNGKTALTLQSLYGLVNSGDHEFEAIVWVSAKASKLTLGEIERIENAIINSLGIFDQIASIFQDKKEDSLENVRNLLENNRILLVIDNLETVLDSSIRDFVSDVPGDSKILLTSRIPVGGDLTVTVGPLSESESETYLRALIKAHSIATLVRTSPEELRSWAKRLGNKPLLMKWFCLGVASGLAPQRILANPEVALKFCLENVFDALGDDARQVLSVMSILPRAVSMGVLEHVSGIDARTMEVGISELLKFTIVEVENIDGLEINYKVKPFARAYINRILKLAPHDKDAIVDRYRGLSAIYQDEKGAEGRDRYNPKNFSVRSLSEALTVRRLRSAIRLASNTDPQDAFSILDDLKISHADYFEVYRAEAFIKYRLNDPAGANEAYETAADLAPDHPQIFYFWAGFLLRSFNDCRGAIEKLEYALELDPKSSEIKRELARTRMLNLDFAGAEEILSQELREFFANLRPKLLLSDLRLQNFQRMISYLASTGIDADLKLPIRALSEFLQEIDHGIVDEIMFNHLKKTRFEIASILSRLGEESAIIEDLDKIIVRVRERIFVGETGHELLQTGLVGSLKEQGRKPNFGFLVESSGREAFLPKASVSELAWEDLNAGSTARYDIEIDEQGRNRAVNVSIVSFRPVETSFKTSGSGASEES